MLGANSTFALMSAWMPGCSVGICACSDAPVRPFAISFFASAVENSFCFLTHRVTDSGNRIVSYNTQGSLRCWNGG